MKQIFNIFIMQNIKTEAQMLSNLPKMARNQKLNLTPKPILVSLPHAREGCRADFSSLCCSVVSIFDSMDCSTPGFLSFTISRSLLRLMSIESVMSSNHLSLLPTGMGSVEGRGWRYTKRSGSSRASFNTKHFQHVIDSICCQKRGEQGLLFFFLFSSSC